MAVRFRGDTTVILWTAAIGAFILAMAQAGLLLWHAWQAWL